MTRRVRVAVGTAVIAVLMPMAAAAQTGNISGTVTNAANGTPLSGVGVTAFTLAGNGAGSGGFTNAAGLYTITNLPPGSYYVATGTVPGSFVPEVFGGIHCVGPCQEFFATAGTIVTVTAGVTTAGRNIALDPGGSITGQVTNAATAAPIPGAAVRAFARIAGQLIPGNSTLTDAAGNYSLRGLPAGNYVVQAVSGENFIAEVYDNQPCVPSCLNALETGTLVPVALGAVSPGRNFALDVGGRVTGRVANAASGLPIANVQVALYTRVGSSVHLVSSTLTSASGNYTIEGLPTGSYYALTSNFSGFNDEIHDDLPCLGSCDAETAAHSGTAIAVTRGATTANRDFALALGGAISGRVTNAATGLPVPNATVHVWAEAGSSLRFAEATSTNASGDYVTTRGLPTGSYRAHTTRNAPFVPEIFDNIPCAGFSCTEAETATRGTPIPVTTGASTLARDFALQPGARITGTVVDASSGMPLSNVLVQSWQRTSSGLVQSGWGSTNSSGTYSIDGLLPGTYTVTTRSSSGSGFSNEVFDNIPCPGACHPPGDPGTAVTVAAGAVVSGINFGLTPGGVIRGTVTESGTGAPIPGIFVNLFQRVGSTAVFVSSAPTNVSGRYSVDGLAPGQYLASTALAEAHFNEIYDNVRCTTPCTTNEVIATGTLISAGGIPVTAGIDFVLERRNDPPAQPGNVRAVTSAFTATFTWDEPNLQFGGSATSFLLEAGLSPGTTVVSIPVSGRSHTTAVPPGAYYVRVRGVNAAGTGPASAELLVVVDGSGNGALEPPTSVVAFMIGSRLTLTWGAPRSGGIPTGYIVEAGSATDLANIASLPVTGTSFTFEPVPAGVYFLRVRARHASGVGPPSLEQMIVVGNVPAPPTAPRFTGHTVAGSGVTLSWTAPLFGTAASYIIEAGSATRLSNLAVVNTNSTALTQSFSGVPPGTYFVRVRAVNAQGISVASNERTIVVP